MAVQTNRILTVYPMDSDVTKFDTDGLPVYDRGYNASDLRTFMRLSVTDGVWTDYLDELTPVQEGGSWYVSAGAAMAGGLLIPVGERVKVCDQADVSMSQYAYLCVAARFDSALRDGAVYARLSSSASEQPERTDSVHELILARVDWRGTMTDLRLDNSMCGPVTAVCQPDTDSFMAELKTAVDQFNLNVGTVSTLPSGSTPEVTVRKPVEAGGEVFIDFGIPRGAPGEAGQSAPGVYVQEERPGEPEEGAVFLKKDPELRQIDQLQVYEVTGTYPGEFYPGEAYPGGTAKWTDYKFNPALVAGAKTS